MSIMLFLGVFPDKEIMKILQKGEDKRMKEFLFTQLTAVLLTIVLFRVNLALSSSFCLPISWQFDNCCITVTAKQTFYSQQEENDYNWLFFQ